MPGRGSAELSAMVRRRPEGPFSFPRGSGDPVSGSMPGGGEADVPDDFFLFVSVGASPFVGGLRHLCLGAGVPGHRDQTGWPKRLRIEAIVADRTRSAVRSGRAGWDVGAMRYLLIGSGRPQVCGPHGEAPGRRPPEAGRMPVAGTAGRGSVPAAFLRPFMVLRSRG